MADDEEMAMSLEELKRYVQGRKMKSTEPLGMEIRLSERNPLGLEHPAVTRLRDWANTYAKLSVTFP
jgi:hypothetical protein